MICQSNNFSVGIPSEIGLLTTFEVPQLVENQLNGSILEEKGQLRFHYDKPALYTDFIGQFNLYLYDNQLWVHIDP